MKIPYLIVLLCISPIASGDMYMGVDADGHKKYSNEYFKGAKKIFLKPLPTTDPLAKARSPSDFPKVDGETQKGRDETRRKILQDELKSEQILLEKAQQNLQNAEGENRGNFVNNGKIRHNDAVAQEYAAEVSKQTADVNLHQQNIDALNAELSKLK